MPGTSGHSMLKYGRFALAEELSGTPGQVTPGRTYEELLDGPLRDRAEEPGVEPLPLPAELDPQSTEHRSFRPAVVAAGARPGP